MSTHRRRDSRKKPRGQIGVERTEEEHLSTVGSGFRERITEEVEFQGISKEELNALRSLCSEFPAVTKEKVSIGGC